MDLNVANDSCRIYTYLKILCILGPKRTKYVWIRVGIFSNLQIFLDFVIFLAHDTKKFTLRFFMTMSIFIFRFFDSYKYDFKSFYTNGSPEVETKVTFRIYWPLSFCTKLLHVSCIILDVLNLRVLLSSSSVKSYNVNCIVIRAYKFQTGL
jgi:hypothetical protein